MHFNMTGQAIRKHFQRILVVGFIMALATPCWFQRSRGHIVKGSINLWQLTLCSRNKPWLEKTSQGDNTTFNKKTLNFQSLSVLVY